ncbi:Transducin beta-like protein 2 [Holothuria leucospilota]|uniref:Transducin beta-like protein 2 n=1 Tax=Holothuria leucospilota TaxID=206669 RepID=A0A9Q1CDG5_HOLLE|nr:Transducin beta-like protein 2 [Holothuria leucospilota]
MDGDVATKSPKEQLASVIIITLAMGAVVGLLMLMFGYGTGFLGKKPDDSEEEEEENKDSKAKSNQLSKKQLKALAVKEAKQQAHKKVAFNHPLLLTSLKEHSQNVLDFDFSMNGKYLASCSEDRTVRLWSIKDFTEKQHKTMRGNVEYDHATQVKFSPDCKAYIVSLAVGNSIRVYKIGKKEDGSMGISPAVDFEKKTDHDIIGIGIGSTSHGNYIMSAYNNTIIHIWDTKGDLLETIDTHQMNHNHAAVSPCGRFVASCGFTPDVKVMEVVFDKSGNFKEVKRAMDLKGHKASVYSFCFNLDSTRVATVSKDGTWKLWDTNVEYHKNQDPYLLYTGSHNFTIHSLIALSCDGHTVAIACGLSVSVYNTQNGEEEERFNDVHTAEITKIGFDPSGRYLVTAGDKHLRVFHNVVGYRANITDMEKKLKTATSQPMRDRLEMQITQARTKLEEILGEKSPEQ